MIEIENVSVKYRTENDIYTAIANVNLVIPDGGTCAVIGPSGCGKSTLLKCVAGLIPDYEGRVLINGEEVNPKAQTIGFMPQNYGLLPWKTVVDNIRLGMKIKKAPELLDRNVIKQLMRQLGIEGLGYISIDLELDAYYDSDYVEDVSALDSNGDKQITFDELKAQYGKEITTPITQEMSQRNEIIAKEIYLSIARYPLHKRIRYNKQLAESFKKAMSMGLDLEDDSVRNSVFDEVVFRVKYLDETDKQLH
ncbi:MAG: ATP-binding cassette domain-containing protein, partial [Selenomonadaceae bacterium]|nr:ATP-binding cassette domain-containing protein [Selenomonadaceae bacterium]